MHNITCQNWNITGSWTRVPAVSQSNWPCVKQSCCCTSSTWPGKKGKLTQKSAFAVGQNLCHHQFPQMTGKQSSHTTAGSVARPITPEPCILSQAAGSRSSWSFRDWWEKDTKEDASAFAPKPWPWQLTQPFWFLLCLSLYLWRVLSLL